MHRHTNGSLSELAPSIAPSGTDCRFGTELRVWRARHKISLRELAYRVHVDFGHLGKVERGARTASRQLADACDAAFSAGGALRAAWAADQAVVGHRPAQLPFVAQTIVGRRDEARHIQERLVTDRHDDGPQVVVVTGPPGVGKTTLALRCANDVAAHFPDGVLYADLHGYSDEAPASAFHVLEQFLLALGTPATAVPRSAEAAASLYRSVLYDRRALVVLDNVGRSEQVLPLLPGGPGSGALVTSRGRLSSLAVRAGAHAVDLPPLREGDALDMLRGVIGTQRVDAESEAGRILARQCSFLPLALRVVAERVATRPWTRLRDLVDDLSTETERLDVMAADDDSLEIRRVFSWSYQALHPEAASLFRLLGLHWQSEISLSAAATLADWPLVKTRRILDMLTGAHLLQEVDRHRYCHFDLLRVYATELAWSTDRAEFRRAAVNRLLRWYLATADAAGRLIAPDRGRWDPVVRTDDLVVPRLDSRAEAVTWFELELPALVGAIKRARDSGIPGVAHELATALSDLLQHMPWPAWLTTNINGLNVAPERIAGAASHRDLDGADPHFSEFDRSP